MGFTSVTSISNEVVDEVRLGGDQTTFEAGIVEDDPSQIALYVKDDLKHTVHADREEMKMFAQGLLALVYRSYADEYTQKVTEAQ